MGVAVQELFHHAVHHILHGEAAPILLDVGVKDHLHQHIAQLLLQQRRIVQVNGLGGLVALLQQAPANGGVGLRLVPGTALRGAKQPDDLQQIRIVVAWLPRKIYHSFPSIAIGIHIFHDLNRNFANFSPLGSCKISSRRSTSRHSTSRT